MLNQPDQTQTKKVGEPDWTQIIKTKKDTWNGVEEADWMARLPDERPLSHICLPGSHDSATAHTQSTGMISGAVSWICRAINCQSLSISEQLNAGVRFLDLRLYPEKDGPGSIQFVCVHGAGKLRYTCTWSESERALKFEEVQHECQAFLEAHPTETIVMSIKKEDGDDNLMAELPKLFVPDLWYTDSVVPALSMVRGKMVLVRRFALPDRLLPCGIDLSAWDASRDNDRPAGVFPVPKEGAEPTAWIQDDFQYWRPFTNWTVTDKWVQRVEPAFVQFNESEADHPLQINCTSCTNFMDVPTLVQTMNPVLIQFLDVQGMGCFDCWIVSDYVDATLCRAVFTLNDPN